MINKDKLQKNALPVKDSEVVNFIEELNKKINISDVLKDQSLKDIFLENYLNWIQKSKLNKLNGLENYSYKSFTHGCIQSFDMFYAEFSSKKFRFFEGEFMYHKLCARNNYKYSFIKDLNFDSNDAVIISAPFSDSGNEHKLLEEVLIECDKKNIPVLIDLAYINLADNIEINLNHNCIHTITLSLSKGFYSLDRLRVGMRLKRTFNDDPIDVFNSIGMVNLFGIYIGNKLINEFDCDFINKKYKAKQINICKDLNIEPSKCIIFGLGGDAYSEFNRGGQFNRVGLSKLLEE